MKRATLRFLQGLFILLAGVFNHSFAHPIPIEALTFSVGAHKLSSEVNFAGIQATQTFVSKSTSPGSGKEKLDFESSLLEKEEEDKSCSFNVGSSDLHQSLISYVGVLNHFQQMVQERLQVLAHSRLLMTSDHATLLQRFQI